MKHLKWFECSRSYIGSELQVQHHRLRFAAYLVEIPTDNTYSRNIIGHMHKIIHTWFMNFVYTLLQLLANIVLRGTIQLLLMTQQGAQTAELLICPGRRRRSQGHSNNPIHSHEL